jgi:hypothetical protein
VESRSLRIGTWNSQYGAGAQKNTARLERLLDADCDVFVLTETHDALALPVPYAAVSSDQRPTAATGGRWVTIWSRLPVRQLATTDPVRTVASRSIDGHVTCPSMNGLMTNPSPLPTPSVPTET